VDTENIAAAATRIVEERAEAPSELTPALPSAIDQVVLKGLERDPTARFQTAKEMAMALEQAALPLTSREVGEWVADIAGEALARRAALVEAIETHEGVLTPPPSSSSGPIPHAGGGGAPAGEAPTLVSIVGPIEALAARAARRAGGEDQITDQITELSVTTAGDARAPPRWGLLVACAVGALSAVLVVGAVALYWLPRRGPAALVVEGDVAPAVTEMPAADPPASAAPIATATATATATASVAPVASATPRATSTATARPTAVGATRPAARPGAAPKVDCNPPFFVSKDGTKQYKPECL
jgi:serine/threonine-protein kinase